jgi:hypothetical protein
VKPPPLGVRPWVAAETGIYRAVNCAYNSLPIFARSSASGDLHLAQLDAVGHFDRSALMRLRCATL